MLHPQGLHQIMLAAPTSSDARMQRIADVAGGFIYYVALKGVTGAANLDGASIAEPLARLRRHTALPVAVGFGIKTADDARAIAAHGDAIVIGSALVQALAGGGDPHAILAEALAPLRVALDTLAAPVA
jgi:tryptophan synthase alpha chain